MLETYFRKIVKDSKLNVELKIEDFDDSFNSYTVDNKIVIKKSLVDNVTYDDDIYQNNNFYCLLKNLYHEIEHIKQKNNPLSDGGVFYELTNYINEYVDKQYYSKNYNREFVELLANIKACEEVLTQVKGNVYHKILNEFHNYQLQSLLLERKDALNNGVSIFKIYPEYIKKVFSRNPHLISTNKIYKTLFNEGGSYKGIINIINFEEVSTLCHKVPLFLYYFWLLELIDTDGGKIIDKDKYNLVFKTVMDKFNNDYIKYFDSKINDDFSSKEYKRIKGLLDKRS